jgi:hypothetical protein
MMDDQYQLAADSRGFTFPRYALLDLRLFAHIRGFFLNCPITRERQEMTKVCNLFYLDIQKS